MIPPISFAFIAALAFSGLNASVGYLTGILDIPVTQVVLTRNGIIFILIIGYSTAMQSSPLGPSSVRGYMIISGLGVAVSVMSGYHSMFYLTLSEFTSVRCMDPFATALLCRIFLNERVSNTQVCCCLLSMVGVILITDPFQVVAASTSGVDSSMNPGDGQQVSNTLVVKLTGLMFTVPSMFGHATELVAMRKVGDKATSVQMMVYLAFCPSTVAAGYLLSTQTALVGPAAISGWIVLFGVVPLGFIGQYALTYAGQRVSGTQISIVMYFGVVSGTLLQWAIYGTYPSAAGFFGMAIVVICGIYAVMYGSVDDHPIVDGTGDEVEEVDMPLLTVVE